MYQSLKDPYGRDAIPNRMTPGAYDHMNGLTSVYGDNAYSLTGDGYSSNIFGNNGSISGEYPGYAEVGNYGNSGNSSSCNTGMCGTSAPPSYQSYYQKAHIPQSMYTNSNQQLLQHNMMIENNNPVQNRTSHLTDLNVDINRRIIFDLKRNIAKITKELGVTPDWMDISPDGGAIWKYSKMLKGNSVWCRVFNRIEISAERKPSKKPLPHVGCITTTTKIKLDCECVKNLQREYPQISYCPNDKHLRITTDSLEHCLSILALISGCQKGKFTINKIRHYKLPEKYMKLTTPGEKSYNRAAKYSLIKMIQD